MVALLGDISAEDVSGIKLFRLSAGKATELQGDSDLEKPLQTLFEAKLEPLFGIRFLATKYAYFLLIATIFADIQHAISP